MIMICLILFLSGCSTYKVVDSYVNNINNIITTDNNLVNKSSIGYKYYLPKGVRLISDNDFNQKFVSKNTHLYLYADVVSYYYKNSKNYQNEEENLYYYTNINNGENEGYLKIKEENNQFYVEIVYNYAKIEMYSSKYYLKENIIYATIILSSIKYNYSAIESLINENYFDNYSHKYVLDKPENSNSNFLEYSEEFNTYEDNESKIDTN